jgi:tRNA (cmo5U34)-methyltransferase
MKSPPVTDAHIWKSDEMVSRWLEREDERERGRVAERMLMADLLPFAAENDFTFLDLGAGTGAASQPVLARYPNCHAILADFSPQMIREGQVALEPYAQRIQYVEFDMLSGEWPSAIPARLDAVITSLCVHHLPDERKQALFAEIHDHLAVGGWYLNYDPIRAEDPAVGAVWERVNDRRDPAAARRRTHPTPAERAQYENHIRHIIPLRPQLEYLRAAGFTAVDVYWKSLDNVVYGGCRAS